MRVLEYAVGAAALAVVSSLTVYALLAPLVQEAAGALNIIAAALNGVHP